MHRNRLALSICGSILLALPAAAFAATPFSNEASNIGPMDTHSPIAPKLPTANLGPNATAAQYLNAAQKALASDRTGLAQSSLENAETLVLTRSIPYTTSSHVPDDSQLVSDISSALRALGRNDIAMAQHYTILASKQAAK